MGNCISIIIPNFNGSRTIGNCLESIFASNAGEREVIVVDDCSQDDSVHFIKQYPCRLIRLPKRSGASAARNAGASNSTGDVLFFIDADCMLTEDTLRVIRQDLSSSPPDVILGGTYTPDSCDRDFFSRFQSVFVNYFETRNSGNPDYLATHALAIRSEIFRKLGGFRENFLPILEDVEFSHRLRRAGYSLFMDPRIEVRHQFNFTFFKSMKNAARKTRYWIQYSLMNRDLLADSGTASRAIKTAGGTWLATVLLVVSALFSGRPGFLMPLPFLWTANLLINRRLLAAFSRTGGFLFAVAAAAYYFIVYPFAVSLGAVQGVIQYLRGANHIREGSLAG